MLSNNRCLDFAEERYWNNIAITPFSVNERRTFITTYMQQYSKSLLPVQIESIIESEQCINPLFLKTMLDELRVFGSFENLDKKIQDYLVAKSIPQLFEIVFTRMEKDLGDQKHLLGIALALVFSSKDGLTEPILRSILEISMTDYSRLSIYLDHFLISRSGYLSFAHDHMRQGVEARYLGKYRNRRQQKYTYYQTMLDTYYAKQT